AQGAGAEGIGQSRRRVFNHILGQPRGELAFHVQKRTKDPRFQIPAGVDLEVDGNLFWSRKDGAALAAGGLPAHWSEVAPKDRFADPIFVSNTGDFRLRAESPAINHGTEIPSEWEDPLREQDRDAPDIGAFPSGAKPWRIGVHGRLTAFPG
ncbi:MAG: hypothetical protein KY475_03970, partial [Planctomycetes bacterium]|nr:hypothetical protein [Planctomycetota bacterium]